MDRCASLSQNRGQCGGATKLLNSDSVSLAEIPIASSRVSRGVVLAAELCVPKRATRHLLTRSVGIEAVSSHVRDFSLDRPPDLSIQVHSLLPSLPFEAPSPYLLVVAGLHLAATCPAWVSSLIAASRKVSTCARACPPSLRSVLRFSQPHDGFLHPLLCGLVSSRYHVQGSHRSGVCPRFAGATTRRRDPAPMPLVLACSPTKTPSLLTAPSPAATCAPLDFEALLRDPMRSTSRLFKPSRGRSPLRFSLLQALAPPPSTRFPGPSTRDLHRLRLPPRERGSSPSAGLQRLVGCVVGASVSGPTDPYEVSSLSTASPPCDGRACRVGP